MQKFVYKKIVMWCIALFSVALVGCDVVVEKVIESFASLSKTEVDGRRENCAVVLRAEQGISYKIAIASEGDWAYFSKGSHIEGVM